MKFIAIIPARYASTRFPGKPLVLINGKPMIRHVYERASQLFAHCYVATDDKKIEHAVEQFGGRVVMTSDRHQSGTDRCAEALDIIEKERGEKFDVVINIQGDEPFICREQLSLITKAFKSPDTDIATLAKQFGKDEDIFDPNTPKVVCSKDGYAIYFSRSVIPYIRGVDKEKWHKHHAYHKHIGLYAFRSEVLREVTQLPQGTLEKLESLEQLRWLENGYKIKVEETTTESESIDTPEDLAKIVREL